MPVGIRTADGRLLLNPDPDLVIEPQDQVIVIAEDDDTYKPEEPAQFEVGLVPERIPGVPIVEKVLLCGWRRDIRDILQMLDSLVQAGSEVHIMTHCVPKEKRNEQLMDEGLDVSSLNIRLVHHFGNTSVRKRLEVLPFETYTSCMIFADQAFETDTMHVDSHSLATLLLIRDIQAKRVRSSNDLKHLPGQLTSIICEVLDSRTQRTISGHNNLRMSSDFVQSNKLIAQILAMVAEARSVKVILDELLGIRGSSLLLVPPHWYVRPGEQVSFWALAKRSAEDNSILIGYQIRGSLAQTVLNPHDKHIPRVWDDMDLAVIAGTAPRKASVGQADYSGGQTDYNSLV